MLKALVSKRLPLGHVLGLLDRLVQQRMPPLGPSPCLLSKPGVLVQLPVRPTGQLLEPLVLQNLSLQRPGPYVLKCRVRK